MALTDNLVSYWKADESSGALQDSAGSNNESSSSGKTYTTGKLNNGANMSGSSSYAYMSGTYPSGANPVTIAGWVKADVTTGNRFVFSYGTDASGQMLGIFTNNTSRFWATSNAGDDDSGVTFNTTDFYHVAIVDNGTTQVMYINGVPKTSRTRTLNKGSGNFTIGNYPAQTGASWDGVIDEIGVWSRALSASEIVQLYNRTRALAYPLVPVGPYPVIDGIVNYIGSNTFADQTVTIPSGHSNLIGILHVANQTNSTTTPTWNGVNMTELQTGGTSGGTNRYVSVWYIIAPTTGTVRANRSSGANRLSAVAIVYAGLNQTGQPDSNPAPTTGTGTSISGSTTTVASNALAVMIASYAGGTPSPTTNARQVNAITDADSVLYDSTLAPAITPAGSFTMTATQASGTYGLIIASFAPAITSYTLTAVTGAFALTGIDAILKSTRTMAMALGTYALTGYTMNMGKAMVMIMSAGTFALTGYDLLFSYVRTMTMAVGTFALTGFDLLFNRTIRMIADVGAYILTGNPILIRFNGWVNQIKNSSIWTNQGKN